MSWKSVARFNACKRVLIYNVQIVFSLKLFPWKQSNGRACRLGIEGNELKSIHVCPGRFGEL